MPRFGEFYHGICLTTEEKTRKNLSHGKKNLSQVNKTSVKRITKKSVHLVLSLLRIDL